MKKIVSVLIICLLLLCACSKKEEIQEGFYLNYNGNKLELNKEFNTGDYGQYNSMFQNASCAFGDRDITYFYKDVEIEAYENKDKKLIVYSIRIISEDGKTNEGIGLYDLITDAIAKYGDKYIQIDNKYAFTKGNTSLIFITQNDIIESIEYRITNIEE